MIFEKIIAICRKDNKLIIDLGSGKFASAVDSKIGKPFAEVISKNGCEPITLNVYIAIDGKKAVIDNITLTKIDGKTLKEHKFDFKAKDIHKIFLGELWYSILGDISQKENSGMQVAKGSGITQIQGNNNTIL